MTESPFRVGYVDGVTPAKWARAWQGLRPGRPLQLVRVADDEQERVLDENRVQMCLLRLPVERDDVHLIRLYDEQPVAVVGREHPVAAFDEIAVADLADEDLVAGDCPEWQAVQTTRERPAYPEMSWRDAVEVVASGQGLVIAPMSLARLHHRKDLVAVPVTGVRPSTIALCWLREPAGSEDASDPAVEPAAAPAVDPDTETFAGVVRGRGSNSSRGERPAERAPKAAASSAGTRAQKPARPRRPQPRGRAAGPKRRSRRK